jgi:hypothetical protein
MNVILFVLFLSEISALVAGWQRDFAPQTAKLAALPTPVPENALSNRPRDTDQTKNQKPKIQLASR